METTGPTLLKGYMADLESDFARKVVAFFEERRDKFLALKHADRFRKGIPDFSILGKGYTIWLELKVIEEEGEIYTVFRERVMADLVQFMTMRRCYHFTKGCAFYIAQDIPRNVFHATIPDEFVPDNTTHEIVTFKTFQEALKWRIPL